MTLIQPHFLQESYPNGFKYLMNLGHRDLQMGKCQLRRMQGLVSVDEELFYTGRHLVWSQGPEVKVSYSFQDPVDFAVWCRFKGDQSEGRQAVCVVLDSTVRCFMPDGQERCLSLPAKPLNVWPANPFGLMFEFDPADRSEIEENDIVDKLMVVESPYGFLEPVHLSGGQAKRNRQSSHMASTDTYTSDAISVLQVLDGRGSGNESLILTAFPNSSNVFLNRFGYDDGKTAYETQFIQAIEVDNIARISSAVIYDRHDGQSVLAFLNGDQLIAQPIGTTVSSKPWFAETAISIAAAEITRSGKRDLLVLENDSTLSVRGDMNALLQVDLPCLADFGSDKKELVRMTRRSAKKTIKATKISNSVDNRIDISFSQGHNLRVTLNARPISDLVSECFDSLSELLDADFYENIFTIFVSEHSHGDCVSEFESFVAAIASVVDRKWSLSQSMIDPEPAQSVLKRYCTYFSIFESVPVKGPMCDTQSILKALQKPFNSLIDCSWRRDDFEDLLSLLFILAQLDADPASAKYYASFDCSLTTISSQSPNRAQNILTFSSGNDTNETLYELMETRVDSFSEFAIRLICELCAKDDLALTYAHEAIVQECVAILRNDPPSNMTAKFYEFIDRNDLSKIMGLECRKQVGNVTMDNASSNLSRASRVSCMMFSEDNRMDEVKRLLSIDRPFYAKLSSAAQANDGELSKQRFALAEKAVATLFGRGALDLYSGFPSQLARVDIPTIAILGKISRTKLQFRCEDLIPPNDLIWPEFNSGVVAGLQLTNSPNSVIDDSWIIFNRPSEPSASHAGFIFALGLSGALKEMKTFHEFEYLNCKHELSTCALLLGVAAANVQSESERVSKLLSIHNSSFLPKNSIDLNLPFLVQASALVGLGLVHMSGANRYYSNLMIQEIAKREISNADSVTVFSDSYSLAAGFSLGFINLGCGFTDKNEDSIRTLSSFIHGNELDAPKGQQLPSTVPAPNSRKFLDSTSCNTNITAPAAIVGIALAYLKSNDLSIAGILELPANFNALQKFTPDTVMILVIGRSLILWETMKPSKEWIDSQLPKYLDISDPNHVLFYCSILAGICFALGLKYAGSGELQVFEHMTRYFNEITQLLKPRGMYFKDRLNKSIGRGCQEAIIVAVGLVMAGSGSLDVLKFLRRHHSKTGVDVKYGYHVAVNMAIGFVFMSGGLYSFSNTNRSVALLLCSCFPRFPINIADNRTHLQPLRYLWVLAAESRCIVTEDIDSGAIMNLPVSMRMDSGEIIVRDSPFLLPSIQNVSKIFVEDENYFRTSIDTSLSVYHGFLHSVRSLYVKKRTESTQKLVQEQQQLIDRIAGLTCPSLITDFVSLLDEFYGRFGAATSLIDMRKWKIAKFRIMDSLNRFDSTSFDTISVQYRLTLSELAADDLKESKDYLMMKLLAENAFLPVRSVLNI